MTFCFSPIVVCLKLATIFRSFVRCLSLFFVAKRDRETQAGVIDASTLTSPSLLSLLPRSNSDCLEAHTHSHTHSLSLSLSHTPFCVDQRRTPAFKTRGVTLISYSYSLNDTTCRMKRNVNKKIEQLIKKTIFSESEMSTK